MEDEEDFELRLRRTVNYDKGIMEYLSFVAILAELTEQEFSDLEDELDLESIWDDYLVETLGELSPDELTVYMNTADKLDVISENILAGKSEYISEAIREVQEKLQVIH